MTVRLFANRIDALIAAENYSVKRGYSREIARKFSYAAPVREYGQDTDKWQAWAIHHIVNNRVHRRPLLTTQEEGVVA